MCSLFQVDWGQFGCLERIYCPAPLTQSLRRDSRSVDELNVNVQLKFGDSETHLKVFCEDCDQPCTCVYPGEIEHK